MASEVSICNLALSHIGANATISALSEQSEEAFHSNLLYAEARDSVLRSFPWGFAKRHIALTDSGSPPGNWLYRYAYPNACLVAQEILQTDVASDPIKYELALSDAFNSRVILTNQENAVLIYTHSVTNPQVFDPLFVQLLSWKLAADLAMPLTRDYKRMEAAYQMYTSLTSEAKTLDANESQITASREAAWITGRA
ncbi:MAG: hypothetical protein ABGY43_10075 [bacterium]|jgi:hypothetical protein